MVVLFRPISTLWGSVFDKNFVSFCKKIDAISELRYVSVFDVVQIEFMLRILTSTLNKIKDNRVKRFNKFVNRKTKHKLLISEYQKAKINQHIQGQNWGVGGGGLSPLRDSTPWRPKGSLFWTIFRHPFFLTDPTILLRAPLAPIYTNLWMERAPKKCNFLSKFSQKAYKRLFWPFF